LAANLTPKEIARTIKLNVSIITKKGANPKGTPPGINMLKNFHLKFISPNKTTAIIIDKDKPKVITICAVGVNT
jgi:hypothetical protein